MPEFQGISDADERRWSRASVALLAAAIVVALAAFIPSPYVIERPGPAVDVLGETTIEDRSSDVISVEGVERFDGDGELRLVTVSLVGNPERPTSWLTVLPTLFDPSQARLPMADVFPENVTVEQREQQNTVLMDDSQSQAAAAAFNALGERVPVKLRVAAAIENGPSEGVLEEGDVILEVGGSPVEGFAQLRERVIESGAGRALDITVERDGERVSVALTPRVPEGGDEPMIGASIAPEYELPHEVDFSLSDIGGPSAGLVFALGLYEVMTPGSLIDGQDVSGTGTIDSSGAVGPIGGLAPKMWAAQRAGSELFLMPTANCAEVPDRVPPGLVVAPVSTLDEAIDAIEAAAQGDDPVGLERCEAAASAAR